MGKHSFVAQSYAEEKKVGLTIGSPTEQATTPLLGFAHSAQPTTGEII